MRSRIYFQICMIFVASFLGFTLLVALLMEKSDHAQFNRELFYKTSQLANMLIPSGDLPREAQRVVIEEISEKMDFDISLFTPDKKLIAATGEIHQPSTAPMKDGMWVKSDGQTRWTAVLDDGRWLVIKLNRIQVPDKMWSISVPIVLVLLVSLTTYPFIRKLTGRIERLQESVTSIGAGDLSARVKVEGYDEVALLAGSFNDTADKIEKLVKAQRLLLANASHELRTPLSRIRLGIEMLDKEDNPERRKNLRNDIKELDALIHEVMLLTRLDSGIEDDMEVVDLMGVVAEEASRYQGCEVEGRPASVNGNLRMLQNMVRNLIDNAYTHGKEPVKVMVNHDEDAVTLIVMDGGAGIPEREWENVFQPFYRAKDKQNVPGFGLGLPIIKKIAEAHGADIAIENNPTSAMTVKFPISKG